MSACKTNAIRYIEENKGKNLPDPNDCGSSVDLTLKVIGGKWKAPILWHLLQSDKPLRFSELFKNIPDITQRMLTRQLREMEQHGIIYRDVYPVVPPRVEYGITDLGYTLLPVLDAMCKWGCSQGWSERQEGEKTY